MSRKTIDLLVNNWPVKVLSLVAAFVLFLFYQLGTLEERYFSVPLEILVDESLIPSGSYPRNLRVTLRGKAESIFLVTEQDLSVYVDLTAYKSEGVFKVPVLFSKQGNASYLDSLEIGVQPSEITISLEKRVTKSLEVIPAITGYPQKGYELSHYFLTPSTVTAEGPRTHMEGISVIYTEAIDLTGRAEAFTERVRLNPRDSLITFPGGEIVQFNGIIQETVILKTFEPVEIIALDLSDRFYLVEPLSQGSIKVQADQISIEEINRYDIRLILDCSGIDSPGIYTLPVKPDLPLGVMVLMYDPQEVILEVREKI